MLKLPIMRSDLNSIFFNEFNMHFLRVLPVDFNCALLDCDRRLWRLLGELRDEKQLILWRVFYRVRLDATIFCCYCYLNVNAGTGLEKERFLQQDLNWNTASLFRQDFCIRPITVLFYFEVILEFLCTRSYPHPVHCHLFFYCFLDPPTHHELVFLNLRVEWVSVWNCNEQVTDWDGVEFVNYDIFICITRKSR